MPSGQSCCGTHSIINILLANAYWNSSSTKNQKSYSILLQPEELPLRKQVAANDSKNIGGTESCTLQVGTCIRPTTMKVSMELHGQATSLLIIHHNTLNQDTRGTLTSLYSSTQGPRHGINGKNE